MGIMLTSYVGASFNSGLAERALDIVVLTTADKDNIRVVIPSGQHWVVVNPHATLEYFCEHYTACNAKVKCCDRLHSNETAQQLQARNKWSTRHPVKLSRKKMSELIRAAGWWCHLAFDAMHEIAY